MHRHVIRSCTWFARCVALCVLCELAPSTATGQAPEPPQLQYWAGHEAPLYAVAYSPDGKNLISASVDGSMRIWDRTTGTLVRRIAAHQGPVLSLAVAPDGLTFASGGRDGKVHWWDLPRWQSLADIPSIPGVPNALAVSPDGPLFVTGDQANIVRLWDANTKVAVRDFAGAVGGVTAVALDVPAKQVIAASGDGLVRVWNLDNAQLVAAVAVGASPALSLRSDGKSLAIGGQDGLLRLALWPPVAPLPLATHNDQAIASALGADGQLTVSVGLDAQVLLVQTADGKAVRPLAGQPSKPTSVSFSSDTKLVATGSDTGLLKMWQTADGVDRGTLAGHLGAISSVAWHPTQLQLASSGADGTIRIWATPTAAKKWGAHPAAAERIVRSQDAAVAVSIGADKAVRLWNTTTGLPLRAVEGLAQPATAVVLGAKGTRVAWGDALGTLTEQNLADGAGSISIGAHAAAITGLAVDPSGKWMASSGAEGLVKLWNLPFSSPRVVGPLAEAPNLLVPLTADQVLGASGVAEPFVYDVVKGQVARKLSGLAGAASSLAVRADGSLVAAGSATGGVRFWNPVDGTVQGQIAGHEGAVSALAFHPKEPLLASSSADGLIRLWRQPEPVTSLDAAAGAGVAGAVAKPLAATPDGTLVAVGRPDGSVQLYRDATLQAGKKLVAGKLPVTAVAVRRDGLEIAAGDQAGQLFAWSAAEGNPAGDVFAHDGAVSSVNHSAGGDRILTTGADGLVRFWQTPLVPSQPFGKGAASIVGLTVSHDGGRVYEVTAERTLKALDATNGTEAYAIDKWPALPSAIGLSPASDIVAVGDESGVVRLRNSVDGAARAALGGHAGAIRSISFNPKKPQFATSSDDGRIRLWEVPTPTVTFSGHQGKIGAVVMSPNGQLIATAAGDKTARLWNLAAGTVTWMLGDSAEVTCVAWKADGSQVVTGNSAKQLRVWNVADGQQLAILEGHAAAITQVAFLADGSVVSGAADGQLKFWNVTEKKETASVAAHAKAVVGLTPLPGGMTVASVGAEGGLKIWNLADKKAGLDQPAAAPTTCVSLSADGKFLALGSSDKSVRILPATGGAAVVTLAGAREAIAAVAFSPDSQRVAVASVDGEVRVYTVAGVLQESVVLLPAQPTSVAFTADGKGLVIGATDQLIHVARLAWQKTLEISQQPLSSITFLPDGEMLLVGGRDKSVAVWNSTAGTAVRALAGSTDAVASVAVSPDGTKLAAVGADKTVRVWNAADGAVVAATVLPAPLRDVRFSRDGLKLAVAGEDGSVRVLETLTGRTWQRWREHATPVAAVAWGIDPRVVFSGTADGGARRLTISATAVLAPEGGAKSAMLFPNAQSLVTWNADKIGKLWTVTGQAGPQLAGAEGAMNSITVRADGVQLAGVAADKNLYFWLAGNGQLERKVALGAVATSVSYSVDSTRVAASCDDGGVRIVQVADGRILEIVPATAGGAAAAALLLPTPPVPNQPLPSERLLVSRGDGQVEIRRPAFVRLMTGHVGAVTELAWTPDGASIFSAGIDKTVRHWTVANGQPVRALAGPTDIVTGLAVVAGGTRVVGASLDKNLRWWNVADGALVAAVPLLTPLRKLSVNRDADAVFTVSDDTVVRLWDAATMKELERLSLAPVGIGPIATGSGRSLIVAAADKSLRVWQPSIVRAIVADAVAVQSLAITPDGQHVLSSGNDVAIKQWDREGKLVKQFAGSPTAWRHLSMSADGLYVVAGGDPARQQPGIFRWKLADGQPLPTIAVPTPVVGLTLAGSGRIAAASADAKVRFYGLVDGKVLEEMTAPAAVNGLASSADGQSLILATADGAVTATQPSLTSLLMGHEGAVASVAWGADGKELFSAGADKTIRRWDVATGKVVGTFAGSVAAVTSLSVSRDGRTLAASTADNIVRLWPVAARVGDAALNDVAARLALPAAPAVVRSVRLNANGSLLAVAGDDMQVHLVDALTGKELERLVGHAGGIWSVAMSDDGLQIISSSADRTVRRWTRSVRSAIVAHEGAMNDVRYSPDGQQLVTAGADKLVRSWNAADLKETQKFVGATTPVRAVSWSSDGGFVAAGGDDQTLRVYSTADGKLIAETKLPANVTSIAIGKSAQRIVVGAADMILRNFSLVTIDGKPQLELLHEGRGHTGAISRVALSADERMATSIGADQTARRWLAAGATPRAELAGNEQAVYGLAFRADGLAVASVGGDRSVRAWKLPEAEPLFTSREHTAAVNAIAFHSSGKQLASASSDGSIRLWDETGKPGARITVGITGKLLALAYSPDGNAVVVGGSSRAIQVFQRGSLLSLKTIDGHNQTIYQLAYNKTGTRLATLDYSGNLFLWDAASGAALFHQQLPVSAATGLAYAPDGVELAIASRDPRVIRVVIPVPVR